MGDLQFADSYLPSDSLLFGNTQRKDPMGDGSVLQAPRFDPKGKSRASTPANGDILALDLGAAEEGTANQNGDAFMQMQLVEQQVRSAEISAVTLVLTCL